VFAKDRGPTPAVGAEVSTLNLTAGHRRFACLTAVLFVLSSTAGALAAEAQTAQAPAPAVSAEAMAQYRRALAEYQAARAAYAAAADAYWNSISQQRRQRNAKRANHEKLSIDDYVLTQPPAYSGPPKPRDPSKPAEQARPPPYVPVVTDFLDDARQEFNFVPRMPQSESEFKRAYGKVALAAGLNAEQIVRIYGFEAGGNGEYDVQAGREHDKQARAITTALGYNQLLATNSVEIIAESGDEFVRSLQVHAATLPDAERKALHTKLAIMRKMIDFARSVPDDWNQHQVLANTPKGLGIHALNLDVDVGPYLQTQKLMDSVNFARRKGFSGTLTAAELEMMNLTGDGNGFDMITMPHEWRDRVPTSNFFQRSGYRDNPVAQRNNVVSKLLAATDAQMGRESKLPGAKDLAAALQ
jgi:hypothetical protein